MTYFNTESGPAASMVVLGDGIVVITVIGLFFGESIIATTRSINGSQICVIKAGKITSKIQLKCVLSYIQTQISRLTSL